MPIQKRLIILSVLFAFAAVLYGAAKYYSPSLILYVVEQSLEQKAPSGTDSIMLRERLHALLGAIPDKNAQMEKLLRISNYLEKVQSLTPDELKDLLAVGRPGAFPAQ